MECLRLLSWGFLLFNIFVSDLFLTLDNIEIAKYADDNIPYCSYENFANISIYTVMISDKEKLLRVAIDNHLKFESHIKNLCSKAIQKLYALSRVSLYMSLNQCIMIMQSFIMSQFGYFPVIWMNHNRPKQ